MLLQTIRGEDRRNEHCEQCAACFLPARRLPASAARRLAATVTLTMDADPVAERAAQRDRPLERGDTVSGLEVARQRVADHAPRPGVEDDREIDEAGRDRDVGDVADPELVAAVDRVVFRYEREDRAVVVAVGGPGKAPPGPWVEVVLAHHRRIFLALTTVPRWCSSAPTRR